MTAAPEPFDDGYDQLHSVAMKLIIKTLLQESEKKHGIVELASKLRWDEGLVSLLLARFRDAGWITAGDPFTLTPAGIKFGTWWIEKDSPQKFLPRGWNDVIPGDMGSSQRNPSRWHPVPATHVEPTVRVVLKRGVHGIVQGQVVEMPSRLAEVWLGQGIVESAGPGIGPTAFIAASEVRGRLKDNPLRDDGDSI